MLTLHFINVGDGDAILAEDRRGTRVFRMLVDTGRKDVGRTSDSPRTGVVEYLREAGADSLDALVITHLHVDHFGALPDLLEAVPVRRIYAGFFPGRPGDRAAPEPEAEKTVRGLIECLNLWSADAEIMARTGCETVSVAQTLENVALTGDLRADFICPSREVNAVQRLTWDAMLENQPLPPGLKYWASKSRNPNSLRLRLTYAGRRIELAGDCYGQVWEGEELAPCDILKVPHHGDRLSLTPLLVEKLRPAHAVISCGAEYIPRKDRPSRQAAELLEARGARVWMTDAFSAPWHPPGWQRAILFQIHEDATIQVPDPPSGG